MHLNLTRNQVVDLLFALELAEDNAPSMRRWVDLRNELRVQLYLHDKFISDPGRSPGKYECIIMQREAEQNEMQ